MFWSWFKNYVFLKFLKFSTVLLKCSKLLVICYTVLENSFRDNKYYLKKDKLAIGIHYSLPKVVITYSLLQKVGGRGNTKYSRP